MENNKHTVNRNPLFKTAGQTDKCPFDHFIDRIIDDIQKLFSLQTGRSFLFHSAGRVGKMSVSSFSYFVFCFLNWISKPSAAGRTFVNGQLVNLSEEERTRRGS